VTLGELKASYEELLRSPNTKRLVVRAPGLRHDVAATGGGSSAETVILHAPSFKQEKGYFSG
jgi:hypothetical protein